MNASVMPREAGNRDQRGVVPSPFVWIALCLFGIFPLFSAFFLLTDGGFLPIF